MGIDGSKCIFDWVKERLRRYTVKVDSPQNISFRKRLLKRLPE